MSETPSHFCPGCGTPQKAFLRYPWYLCQTCIDKAVDGAGRALEFTELTLNGGFAFRYAGEGEDAWRPCFSVVALVSDRPVRIDEARFGGIVAEPIPNRPLADAERICDLSRKNLAKLPLPRKGKDPPSQ